MSLNEGDLGNSLHTLTKQVSQSKIILLVDKCDVPLNNDPSLSSRQRKKIFYVIVQLDLESPCIVIDNIFLHH